MAEKRGNTGKLKYDFNTAGVLEVWLPRLEGWYRTTAKEFRSFDGKRRITQPVKVQGKGEVFNAKMEVIVYRGPVYASGTNTEVKNTGTGKIVNTPHTDRLIKISGNRL